MFQNSLGKQQGDASLAEQVRSTDSYLALADLSDRAGNTRHARRTANGVHGTQRSRAGRADDADDMDLLWDALRGTSAEETIGAGAAGALAECVSVVQQYESNPSESEESYGG